ncbi:MAG: hypothetical protein HY657_16695 [Acidobacteria bacterium]|nr:hypothetical protein [Acidobacteriota bacterium]
MRFLLVAKQEKNVAAYLETLRCLTARGHDVTVAVQERDDARDRRLEAVVGSERFRMVPCPPDRIDVWAEHAALVRRLRDCLQYLRPPFKESRALQTRVFQKLQGELGSRVDGAALAGGLDVLSSAQIDRLEAVLRLAEHSLPTSPLFDELARSQRPDALLVSPLIHFGSAQADIVASGRALGVPVWMLLFSWDNLSTKGCMHVPPDLIFAWNERQRVEAEQLHGFPPSRVVVVGAPRFDEFFALRPALTRDEFHAPLGLDASKPTLLYLCSSRLVAPCELEFVRRWLGALRTRRSDVLRECNVVIRPHPDIDLLPESTAYERHRWPARPGFGAHVVRPFEDPRAIVVRTSYRDPRGLYESLVHSTAVVGLNTTAELEAGIVGRPVFTVLPGSGLGGQQATVHFHYLTREHGGFVSVAAGLEEHVEQVEAALVAGVDPAPIRSFIESFLRPHGIDRPVAPLLAEALEARASSGGCSAGALAPAAATPRRLKPARYSNVNDTLPLPEPDASHSGDVPIVPLAYRKPRILVHAVPAAGLRLVDGAVPLDRGTVKWLERSVRVGDVVYDVYAGWGPYALVAAKRRGAVVVAFEPGYQVYGTLCENLQLNACHTSVVPVPLALGNRDRLVELKYKRTRPGSERHALQRRRWRPRPVHVGASYLQPVCAARLDTAVEQYGLPPANHLRLSPRRVGDIIEGASRTLTHQAFRSLWLEVALGDEAAVVQRFEALGLRPAMRKERRRSVQMVLEREPPRAR